MAPVPAWLPAEPHFGARLAALKRMTGTEAWREAEALARIRLDFTETGRLDRLVQRLVHSHVPKHLAAVRVALLASCTVQHLLPSLRLAALRRGLQLEIYVNAHGQYLQD